MRTPHLLAPRARSRAAATLALVLGASLCVQLSAILAHGLFDRLGPMGVSGLRFALAALIAVAVVRPRLSGRRAASWASIALFGASIASMNAFLYLALERLPLGIALTLEFLGPFAVAVAAARRPRAVLFPVIGFVGVVLIVRPSGELDPIGVVFGAVAAASLAGYTLLAERVSREHRGFDGLALALVVAAVLTAPFGVTALPRLQVMDLPVLAASAALGIVVAFAADYVAVALSSARTVSVLLSFDPVLAAVLGAVMLGQRLDLLTVVGIVLVAVAGGVTAALTGRPQPARRHESHLARRRRRTWRAAKVATPASTPVPAHRALSIL